MFRNFMFTIAILGSSATLQCSWIVWRYSWQWWRGRRRNHFIPASKCFWSPLVIQAQIPRPWKILANISPLWPASQCTWTARRFWVLHPNYRSGWRIFDGAEKNKSISNLFRGYIFWSENLPRMPSSIWKVLFFNQMCFMYILWCMWLFFKKGTHSSLVSLALLIEH